MFDPQNNKSSEQKYY